MAKIETIWLPITGYEGRYEISDCGKVRNLVSGIELKPRFNKQGYVTAMLYGTDGKPKNKLVHRLVCFAFNGEAPRDKQDVNHLDGIKSNNIPTNLEWTNDRLNIEHGVKVLGNS